MSLAKLRATLRQRADKRTARISQSFFKTGPGEYGEGDVFLGIRVPLLRKLAREYQALSIGDIQRLLKSPVHEERLLALLLLVKCYAQGDDRDRKRIYGLYLKNTRYVNNWDLVDVSASYIVGPYLADRCRQPLYRLARSRDLWGRRIAIMATYHYIKNGEFIDTLKLTKLLLTDEHDLIHKAVGWMLREVGKRDPQTAERFLKQHYRKMPRTMLRYAIERLPKVRRQAYLQGKI